MTTSQDALSQRAKLTWVLMVGVVGGVSSNRLSLLGAFLVTAIFGIVSAVVGGLLLARGGRGSRAAVHDNDA